MAKTKDELKAEILALDSAAVTEDYTVEELTAVLSELKASMSTVAKGYTFTAGGVVLRAGEKITAHDIGQEDFDKFVEMGRIDVVA